MDSLTHIALGACIGEVLAGKKAGRAAIIPGIISQSFPDIDFIASAWLPAADNLLAHRGITHSFFFIALVSPLLGIFWYRFNKMKTVRLAEWILFSFYGMLIHIILDAFNAYGVGWLEPFNHTRISFHVLFVADPLFSIWPGIGVIVIILTKNINTRNRWAKMALAFSFIYLITGITNKLIVEKKLEDEAIAKQTNAYRHFSSPTPFNTMLWYIVFENDSGYFIGYRSVFDRAATSYRYYPKNKYLLKSIENRKELSVLERFSQGYYVAEKKHDTLLFNDLRFGQQAGWMDNEAGFVFHYYLDRHGSNRFVLQRGRVHDLEKKTIYSLLERIKGK